MSDEIDGSHEKPDQAPLDPIHPAQGWPFRYPGESAAHFSTRIARGYRDMPEAYHLHRIRWQIMGHFTFERSRIPQRKRRQMFNATMRELCKSHRMYFPKLIFALREEWGTRKDLTPHFHFLLAALPGHIDRKRFCRDCEAAWRAFGGGIALVELYTRQLDGAGYIAKRPDSKNGPAGDDCGLTFSDATLAYLRRLVKRERGI